MSESSEDKRKLISFRVEEEVYWEFKKAAAARKERMDEAGLNAVLLYMDCKGAESHVNAE